MNKAIEELNELNKELIKIRNMEDKLLARMWDIIQNEIRKTKA